MATYNRGALLADAIRSVLAQTAPDTPVFELLVVDNNSSDDTRAIVQREAAADRRVRYLFEPQQGLSHARNAGINATSAPIIAFTDDDVRAGSDWVAALFRAFLEFPDASIVGGRVLPMWPSPPPAWLTADHWSPLAIVDYGDAPIRITPADPRCLVGANMAFRRSVFESIGMFATDFQRVGNRIGSLEDHEFLLRLLRAGLTGVYDPRVIIHAEVQPNRLEREYHRRWHTGHGHFHALLRSEVMEQTSKGRWFGLPAHLYRQAISDLLGFARAVARRDQARAFYHEVRLRFFGGFLRTRCAEHFTGAEGRA